MNEVNPNAAEFYVVACWGSLAPPTYVLSKALLLCNLSPMTSHASDSLEQRLAEHELLLALQQRLGATFSSGTILPIDLGVKPDGIDLQSKIVVEVFSRIGKPKAAQKHKVKADLLKLAFIRKELGSEWRAVFCFADADAAAFMRGQSWARKAAEAFGIEIVELSLSDETKRRVLAAQARQDYRLG